jgi:hypothetical protein
MKLLPYAGVCLVVSFPIHLSAQQGISVREGSFPAADTVVFTSSTLPIILIDTHGKTIPNEPKITANMKIIDNGDGHRNSVGDTLYNFNGVIGIEKRGSSSQQFPKNHYGIETQDSSGNGIDVSLLGFPAESDWILSAPYSDKSLMRDFLSYTLTRSLGRYATRARFCELVLNGRYWGIYVLYEKIKRGKDRVDISKLDSTANTGDDLTGGYIIRVDKDPIYSTRNPGISNCWPSPYHPYGAPTRSIFYQYYYPALEKISVEQKTYIQNTITAFEAMMNDAGYSDPINGYSKYLDVGSAVDYCILNEFTKNIDGYRLSLYLHKNKDSRDGRIVIGPVWDFSNSMGNCNYYDTALTGWAISFLTTDTTFLAYDGSLVPFWWKKLFEDPGFINQAKNRWIEIRQNQFTLEAINGIIDSTTALLDEAQQRNFIKWPILGTYVWPNLHYYSTYAAEIAYLKNWIRDRIAWMDVELTGSSLDIKMDNDRGPSTFILYQNYPNPFNPSTTIVFDIPAKSFVSVKIFDILGKEVTVLVNSELPVGRYSKIWSASGVPSGVYFCRVTAGPSVETTKLLLCR